MAANKLTIEVLISDNGTAKLVQKGVEGVGKAAEGTTKKTKEADNAAKGYFHTQEKGIIGTANSTKSFSKLSQTIGDGSSGLVGAYATLAANAFAVSAAFNALRSAAQAEMVLRGLEEQGARTGRTLTLAAEKLREVVGFGISSAEAMSATAQFTATGFSTDELVKLGEVAQNTSLALGRNLPDSLDRLIKGTTKLEPELLDELGIMTKLGDATAAYALEIGKPVASLTQFERRQAFLNAVLQEGQVKFGGLSEAIAANPYDKLAASFDNLVKETTNFINNGLGVANVVGFLSNNSYALTGVLLLFASTIKNQLLGSLADLAKKSVDAAAATREYAKNVKTVTAINIERAQAEGKVQLKQAANIDLHTKSAAAIKKQEQALKAGSLSVQELDKLIDTNNRSLRQHVALLEKDAAVGKDTGSREQIIKGLTAQGTQLENLKKVTANYNAEAIKSVQVQIASKESSAATAKARSQEAMATAIQSVNNGNLRNSYSALVLSSREYAIALALETRAKKLAAQNGGALEIANYRLAKSTQGIRVAANFAVSGLKLLGAQLLNAIPYIGAALVAWDMLTAAYEAGYKFLFPKTAAAQEKVAEKTTALTEVLTNAAKAHEQYNRILVSSMALGARYSLATENQANSIAEQTNALKELVQARIEELNTREEESSTGFFGRAAQYMAAGQLAEAGNYEESVKIIDSLQAKTEEFNARIGTVLSKNLSGDVAEGIRSTFNSLERDLGTEGLTRELTSLGTPISALNESDLPLLVSNLERLQGRATTVAEATKSLREGFTSAETAITKLVNSIIPSTAFDGTIEAFDSVINSINQLRAAGQTDTQIAPQLTQMSAGVEMFLDSGVRNLVESFREADRVVQQLGSRVDTLSDADKERLESARRLLSTQGNYVDEIKDGLAAARAELDAKREAVALSQAQASFEQNRASKFQAYLNAGAAGYRAQIQSEERVRALSVAGLAANKAILDAKIAQEQANINKLKTELETLEAERDSISNINLFNQALTEQLFMLEARKELIEGTLFTPSLLMQDLRQSGIVENTAQDQVGTFAQDFLREQRQREEWEQKNGQRVAELQNQIEQAERAILGMRLASRVLGTQIAAEMVKNLTEPQKRAKEALVRQEAEYAAYQRKEKTLEAQHSEALAFYRNIAIRRGLDESLDFKIEEIDREFSYREQALQRSLNAESALIRARVADAEAMKATANAAERQGIDEYIAQQNNILLNLQQQTSFQQAQLASERESNILSQIGLNTEVKRQEALLQSTEYLTKQLDTTKELASAMQDLYASERELAEARGGYKRSDSEILQRADRIEAAREAVRIAEMEFETRKAIITMEFALLEAKRKQAIDEANSQRTASINLLVAERAKGESADQNLIANLEQRVSTADTIISNLGGSFVREGDALILSYGEGFNTILTNGIEALEAGFSAAVNRLRAAQERGPRVQGGLLSQYNLTKAEKENIGTGPDQTSALDAALSGLDTHIARTKESLQALGPEGEVVLAIMEGSSLMAKSFMDLATTIKEGDFGSIAVAGLQAVSAAIQTVSSILKSSSDAKIANIDKEIAAEQKRDGKSAQSVAKLDSLEKKKDAIARKQFNTNKKLMIAQAITSTAAAIAGQLASPPVGPWNIALAAMMGAMGMAQVAVIAGTQYESSYTPKSVSTPSSISIGKRGSTVDLAGGPNANAGGEVGYLRGAQGTGTNASNYRTVGSAYGGEMMRGYGNRGFVVGEKGPEVINPETPISVTPANDINSAQPINANISIQALDGADVKRVLVDNRGNIIQMLREAANNSGQRFLEDVNVNVYTRPNIGKL